MGSERILIGLKAEVNALMAKSAAPEQRSERGYEVNFTLHPSLFTLPERSEGCFRSEANPEHREAKCPNSEG